MKLIRHRETDTVLGVHIAGDDAAEMIQGFAVALTAGATKSQFDETLAIHPTSAEVVLLKKVGLRGRLKVRESRHRARYHHFSSIQFLGRL